MIIIFGSKSRVTSHAIRIPEWTCNCCQNKGMELFGHYSYGHVYWIPIKVREKSTFLICPKCRHNIDDFELPRATRKKLKQMVFKPFQPFHANFGLFVFLFLFTLWGFAFLSYEIHEGFPNTKELIHEIQRGDP